MSMLPVTRHEGNWTPLHRVPEVSTPNSNNVGVDLRTMSDAEFAEWARGQANPNNVGVEPEGEYRPTADLSYYPDIEEEREAREMFEPEDDSEPDDAEYDRIASEALDAAFIEPGEGWHEAERAEAIGIIESRKGGFPW